MYVCVCRSKHCSLISIFAALSVAPSVESEYSKYRIWQFDQWAATGRQKSAHANRMHTIANVYWACERVATSDRALRVAHYKPTLTGLQLARRTRLAVTACDIVMYAWIECVCETEFRWHMRNANTHASMGDAALFGRHRNGIALALALVTKWPCSHSAFGMGPSEYTALLVTNRFCVICACSAWVRTASEVRTHSTRNKFWLDSINGQSFSVSFECSIWKLHEILFITQRIQLAQNW